MTLDKIAEELHHQEQEKAGLINESRTTLFWNKIYFAATGSSWIGGGVTGTIAAYADKLEATIVSFVISAVGVLALGYNAYVYENNRKLINEAERELKQIRENPAYEKLDSMRQN